MNKSKWALIVLGFFLVLSYQNCSNPVDFGKAGATLVELPESSNGLGDMDDINIPPEDVTDEEDSSGDGTDITDPIDREDLKEEKDPSCKYSGESQYLCILDRHGDSTKLALELGGLAPSHSIPQSICMTQSACLEVVSMRFPVAKAKRYVGCNSKNKHVIHLNDQEVIDLLLRSDIELPTSSQ